MDPPCVARANDKPGEYGLASMYQASCWSSCSGPSWKSARIRSYYRQCLEGLLGSSVLGCAGKTIFPSLLFLSQTWVGKTIGAYIAFLLVLSSSLAMADTAAASCGLGRGPHRSNLKVTTAMKNAPGDASYFVGECNR